MLAEALRAHPAGVDEALALLDGLDEALVNGLARLDDPAVAALESLAGAFAGSPLADRVADATGKVIAGTVTDEHLVALAGARAALFGAVHDALLAAVRPVPSWTATPLSPPPAAPSGVAGSRSWLRELAIAGWRGVDHELAGGAAQTVQALLSSSAGPSSGRRLAVLLDGFAAELRAGAPVATLDRVPVRRWADLWSRAVLLSQDQPIAYEATTVDGRLLVLGADLHEHPTVFQVQVHALLETAGGVRMVRASAASAKVDTISGPSVWRLLSAFPVLLGALAGQRDVMVTGMPITPGGDLLWDESRAVADDEVDPFATARVLLPTATAAPAPPLDRHPVAIAAPVLLEGYAAGDSALDLGGVSVAVDLDRLPAAGPLTPALVAASTACIGLLRWDDGWSVQPLAVQSIVKKKPVAVHTGDWALGPTEAKAAKAEAAAGTAVDVLRERAGKLLRK